MRTGAMICPSRMLARMTTRINDPRLREPGPFHMLTLERITRDRRQTQALAGVDAHAAWMHGLDVEWTDD